MKKSVVFIFYLFFPFVCFCQDLGKVPGLDSRHFQLVKKADTIDFILVKNRIDTIKPLLIYCQGSTPIPLIIRWVEGDKFIAPISDLDYTELANRYHLILISMPNTPFEVRADSLNKKSMYVLDTANWESLDPKYLKNNYLEHYVSRANSVVEYLTTQKWVDKRKMAIVGHSQGAKVAIETARINKRIYKVGFLNGNLDGRVDQYIRLERYSSFRGKKTPQESQKSIDDYYSVWKDIKLHPKDPEIKYGDPNFTWYSFDKPLLPTFLKIKIPIYVAYGTEDYRSVMCDLLPIHFINANKDNLTLKAYPGLDHSFREVDKMGEMIYDKVHWQDVIKNLIEWLDSKV